jgi:hypothetical protein
MSEIHAGGNDKQYSSKPSKLVSMQPRLGHISWHKSSGYRHDRVGHGVKKPKHVLFKLQS